MKINQLWLGTWRLLGKHSYLQDAKESIAILKKAQELSFEWLDSASFYEKGQVEAFLGKKISKSKFKIASKVGLSWQKNQVVLDASAKAIKQQVKNSLKTLKRDYLDAVLLHWPDPNIAIEESFQTLKDCCQEGLAASWGVCNVLYDQAKLASSLGAHFWHMEHNLLHPGFDFNAPLLPLAHIGFSPLAQGFLISNKKNFKDDDFRVSSHMKQKRNHYEAMLKPYLELSKHSNESLEWLATQWLKTQHHLDGIIIGPRSLKQLDSYINYLNT